MQVAIPLMLAQGILSANAANQQGQNASRAATSAANQIDSNAQLARIAANNATGASQKKAQETLRQNKLLQSKQIAIAAAGGSSAGEKNVQDVISNTAAEGRYAADIDIYEGALRSNDLLNQAIGLDNKSKVTRYEGQQARRAGNMNAVSSIIGSTAQAGSFYGKYGQKAPGDYSSDYV